MFLRSSDFSLLLVPLGLATAGFAAGILFRLFVLPRLAGLARRTSWKVDDLLLHSIKGPVVFWFTLFGADFGSRLVVMPQSLETLVRRVLVAGLFLSITWVAGRAASGLVRLYAPRNTPLSSASLVSKLVNISIITLGGLVLFQTLGIAVTPILTALGVGGLAVALALQDTLANLFAGIYVAASGQIRPGDLLRLDSGEEGNIADIGWRNTTIRNMANNLVVIPNSKLAAAVVTNYDLPQKEIGFVIPVGVSYQSDLENVERVTQDVARDVLLSIQGGQPSAEPVVRYSRFGERSIEFNVVFRGRDFGEQFSIKHAFIKQLHARFRKEGIEISFPVQSVRLEPSFPQRG